MDEDRNQEVLLVDADDRLLGRAPKLDVHREGRLHRAFSVFVFAPGGAMLLQRRALGKYHSGGLWSNACCSHPRDDGDLVQQARARLREEMGVDCALELTDRLRYRLSVGGGMVEHEIDHVLCGVSAAAAQPDPAEVMETAWVPWRALRADLAAHPHRYSVWFALLMQRCEASLEDFRSTRLGTPP